MWLLDLALRLAAGDHVAQSHGRHGSPQPSLPFTQAVTEVSGGSPTWGVFHSSQGRSHNVFDCKWLLLMRNGYVIFLQHFSLGKWCDLGGYWVSPHVPSLTGASRGHLQTYTFKSNLGTCPTSLAEALFLTLRPSKWFHILQNFKGKNNHLLECLEASETLICISRWGALDPPRPSGWCSQLLLSRTRTPPVLHQRR